MSIDRTTRPCLTGSELEALRDYQRDDEYRAIDWKATARRQKPITREYQQGRNQTVLWRERLARELGEAGALVLHVSPRKLTLSLINRYLHIKAQRLL